MPDLFDEYPASLDERWQVLEAAREHLLTVLSTGTSLTDPRGAETGRWSPAEIVFHLYKTEKSVARLFRKALAAEPKSAAGEAALRAEWDRVRRFVRWRHEKAKAPVFVEPTGAPELAEGLRLLAESRQEFIHTARGLSWEQLISIARPHPFEYVGVLTGAGWLSMIAAHELRHADQIHELSALPAP
jgi:DinB family protein